MKISVIAIFYNSEQYVHKCIDSLISQKNVDMEIIAVDDGSTDNTASILQEYIPTHNEIKIYRHASNRGISESRNTGLGHVTGDCFYLIDGDDWLTSEFSLSSLAAKFCPDVDWVQGSYEKVDEHGKIIGSLKYPDASYSTIETIMNNFGNLNFYYTHNKLFNAKYKERLFKNGCYHEDRMWIAEVFPHINCIQSVSFPTYSYLIRLGQTSNQARSQRLYIDSGMQLLRLMAECPSCWQTIRDTFQIVDIEKPLYLWSDDKEFRKTILKDLKSINTTNISTKGFPRFNRFIHAGISFGIPDFIMNLFSKTYFIIMNYLGKPL